MGGDDLDAQLEPLAQLLIFLMVLIAVAAIAFLIINKVAQRRRERAHLKLSGSRRTKHTQVDLFGGASAAKDAPQTHTRRRRSSSSTPGIDILAKPKAPEKGDGAGDGAA